MGSDLYNVEVRSVEDKRVVLRVEEVHPDAGPAMADVGFALMVLWEGGDKSALAGEVSIEDTMDSGWLTRWGRGFIAEVAVAGAPTTPMR